MGVRGAARRHEQVPEARGLGLGLQILDDLDDLPAVAGAVLLLVGGDGGADLALDELAHAALPMLLPVGEVEIHRCFLSLYVHVNSCTDSPALPSPAAQKIASRRAPSHSSATVAAPCYRPNRAGSRRARPAVLRGSPGRWPSGAARRSP